MGERVVIDGEYEKPCRAARERIGMIFRGRCRPWRPHVVEGLIAGRNPSEEATAKRRANVLDVAKRFAAGEGNLKALNPDWDNTFLDQLAANDLAAIDAYTNDSIKELGGQSGQETRNWIAAYAALSATPTHHCVELAETAHAAADECSDLSIGCVAMRRSDELSAIPRGCCERNCVRNAAQRRRSLRAFPRKVFICSTRRRSASTRKTPPSRIIPISGRRIVQMQKRSREKLAPCFENKIYAASSNHNAAAG